MSRFRAAFVMEQTLGHVTYMRNLTRVVSEQGQIVPTWLPIPFDVELDTTQSIERDIERRALGRQDQDATLAHDERGKVQSTIAKRDSVFD